MGIDSGLPILVRGGAGGGGELFEEGDLSRDGYYSRKYGNFIIVWDASVMLSASCEVMNNEKW